MATSRMRLSLLVVLLLVCFPSFSQVDNLIYEIRNNNEVVEDIKGDINSDGKVDSADVNEIEKYIMGNPSPYFDLKIADVNDDGVVNVADIVCITKDKYCKYLTFVALEDGYFSFKTNSTPICYSLDGGSTWSTLNCEENTPIVRKGQKIMWKGNLTPNSSLGIGMFSSTGMFDVEGNIMSLLHGDNFEGKTSLAGKDYAFYNLFNSCAIISAENLRLPATTLAYHCYDIMFIYCTSLKSAPSLPATTLTEGCYNWMFADCSSLAVAPDLSATTLAYGCYEAMFTGCKSLTVAPELPATTLAEGCYVGMFGGCKSLTVAPELPATTLAEGCYAQMFDGCKSLRAAPVLPATTLLEWCYDGMFSGCSSLSYIKCLATDISATDCTRDWVNGVSSSGTFVKASSMSSFTTGNNGIPSGWSINDTESGTTNSDNDNPQPVPQPVPQPTPQPVNPTAGYAVDLGLSIKWASCNVGALSCEEFGDRFAWGELSPKNEYTRKTYQHYDTDTNSYVDIGTDIGGTAYDVAHVRWGGGWRMPTWYELKELRENCTWTWSKVNGVNGYIVKGKNGNSIFFPVEDKSITLWACNLGEDERDGYYGVAELIRFSNSSYTWNNSGEDRWKGNFVRPVCHDEDLSGSSTSGNYLTFVAEETGTFDFQHHYINQRLVYSLDNGLTWYRFTSETKPFTVQAGKKIMWKADFSSSGYKGYFKSSGRFHVEGNIMSLIYGDFFEGKTDLTGTDEAFRSLFSNCARLTNAEKLILPATTLSDNCYNHMFNNCTSLTTPPQLPATKLANGCYLSMFYNCTSLTTPPQLPATKLANGCYMSMFEKCTSLTTAPTLPSTTLSDVCYGYMFEGCSRLNYIKCLATDISAYGCTISWVNGVSSSGTFVKASSMSSWTTGENGIPSGWSITESGTTNSDNDNPQPVPPPPVNPQPGGNNEGSDSDTSGNYLTFVALEDGYFRFRTNSTPISYSLDGGSTWSTLDSDVFSPMVSAGQKIMWKGNLTPKGQYDDGYFDGIGKFRSTGSFNVEGNIMSLLYGDSFEGKKSLAGFDFAFTTLFVWCKRLVNAEKLLLPATTLSKSCYQEMFKSPLLITVPKLPAMTLAEDCYTWMFHDCTSLVTVPSDLLPATNLTGGFACYSAMFSGCTSLTTAPDLPATRLEEACYLQMFENCTALVNAPELPATTLAGQCYDNMFHGCTSLKIAPTLPARSLVFWCYTHMFDGCSNLNYIKCLATDISANSCTSAWLKGVASSGTFFKAPSASWTTGNNGIPSGWTVCDEK